MHGMRGKIEKGFILAMKKWLLQMKEGARLSMEEFSIKYPEDGYRLRGKGIIITADGILPRLVKREPRFAGWSSVVVVHSDMVASGGKPEALLISVTATNRSQLKKITEGVKDASSLLGIPVCGGHTILGGFPSISAFLAGKAVLRRAVRRVSTFLVGLLTDMEGKRGTELFPSWNSFYNKTPEEINRKRRCILNLYSSGLLHSLKDISTGGIPGTWAIAMEEKGCGGELYLDSIPCPPEMDFGEWLKAFQSFGFIAFLNQDSAGEVKRRCEDAGLVFEIIGESRTDRKLYLVQGNNRFEFFDFSKERILKWD